MAGNTAGVQVVGRPKGAVNAPATEPARLEDGNVDEYSQLQ